MNYKKITTAVCAGCLAASSAFMLTGCGATFEGSGSKEAASAEQLALRLESPWAHDVENQAVGSAPAGLHDGTFTGSAPGMDGMISVTLEVKDGVITTTAITQEGESQSVGGFEAIRDGRYAEMIDKAQSAQIDTVSGATITTSAVKKATQDAIDQSLAGEASTPQADVSK